jgi:hypothetical protein
MKIIKSLALAGLASTLPFAAANATLITGGFTGSWYDPDTSGQGFSLQILPNGDAVAYWFTYDVNGNQAWFIGNDKIEGNRLEMDMLRPTGASFGPDFDSDDIEFQSFGTVSLTFENCNEGEVTWVSDDPLFSNGTLQIERLSKSAGVSCSGSIADNRSGSDPVLDFKVPLVNNSGFPDAEAKAEYESRPGRVEFEVEIEDVPVGSYTLIVDGTERGVIQVEMDGDDAEGYIEFSSPRDDDELLLDFEPLGALIEVTDGTTTLFSGVLDPELGTSDDDDNDQDRPAFGKLEIDIDFDNTGVDSDASGDLEWEQYPGRTEFEIEVEDLNIGTYEVWVGNDNRGEFQVVLFDDDTEGELKFSDPAESGKLLLDFDPRGQTVTIQQDGTVYLTAEFPTEADQDDDDEDNDDDNDDDDDDDEDGDD